MAPNRDAPLAIPELCVHALAQLPEQTRLELGRPHQRAMLELVARGYGIRDRITFGSANGDGFARFLTGAESIDVEALLPATLGELVERIGRGSPSPIDNSSDGVLSGQRVVIVTNYPAHYRLPLFEQISTRLARVDAHLHVVFLATHAKSRPWLTSSAMPFDFETVPSMGVPIVERGLRVPLGLGDRLRRLSPTVALAAGFSPLVAGRAARVAEESGASFGLWSGETAVMPTARRRTRSRLRRRLVVHADFAIAYGERAARYLHGLRLDLPLVIGRNTAPAPSTLGERTPFTGSRPLKVVLIGDLASTRKGPDIALDALRRVNGDVQLDIVGDGRLRSTLEHSIEKDSRVRFEGALSPRDVTCKLLGADALLLPTRSDVFGLVLVEAMGAGAVPIVSRAAGAVDDLAVDGYNAIVLGDQEPSSWARAIERLASSPALITELSARARTTIEARWTMEHAVDAMMAGLSLGVLARGRQPA